MSRGSVWHRWDPHIHTPGTVLSDQYPAQDGWEQFLGRIETADPPVRALGITDYYSVTTYEQVVAHKQAGRLEDVELIFPNVELRLGVGTNQGSPVNIHLLVSPDDHDHVDRLRSFLSNLEFETKGERYRCTPAEIMRLGRAHDASVTTNQRALEVGTNQFKVDLADLRKAIRGSKWAQENILIAVAASANDGTAGLQGDASLARQRREIESAAHIIFSGRPGDRAFWLGQGVLSREVLKTEYNGIKPCLHGSDAHRPDRVAAPDQDRRCWLKGDLKFETLRQACLEPEIRVFVGTSAPPGPKPSQIISEVAVGGASFLTQPTIPLNPGLVGIIGARGSGKTALADLIAVGAEAFSLQANRLSFVDRAWEHLSDARVDLTWEDESGSGKALAALEDEEDANDQPWVRYLSQQFVDRLCSAEGLTDELLEEIQRVIFLAHPTEDRMGTTDFGQLLDLKAEAARLSRSHYENAMRDLAEEFVRERDKEANVAPLKGKLATVLAAITKSQSDRTALVGKSGGDQERLKAYAVVAEALQTRRSSHEQLERRRAALENLARQVALDRSQGFPEALRQMKARHQAAQLPDAAWSDFLTNYVGDVDKTIAAQKDIVTAALRTLAGSPLVPPDPGAAPSPQTLLPADTPLNTLPISLLHAESLRLEALVGVDKESARALASLNSKIAADEGQAANLRLQISTAEQAPARLAQIKIERRDAYASVFQALIDEQAQLTQLYAPLATRIDAQTGSAKKLSFEVRRRVDIEGWANAGEALLDLRKGSVLRRGSLADLARQKLARAWAAGTADEVSAALAAFRDEFDAALVECCPHDRKDPANATKVRKWGGELSAWLYSTRHITIDYGIQYDGTEVERLSPGTRGIVLLLLYLAIDLDDDRPLLIDQPEENLDPKSIFVELVERFREAKQRRQIIIVTHNANLIVNTDADQVIVASCGPHRPGQLPEISYTCGGLEDPEIRASVCDILEGGEDAFKERAKRLRVSI
jgi:ABC-type lipoprotein export system ATPase subunit